jgi:hypothetical protein
VVSVGRAAAVALAAVLGLEDRVGQVDRAAVAGRAEKGFRMECQAALGGRAEEEPLDEEDRQAQVQVMGPMLLLPQTAL